MPEYLVFSPTTFSRAEGPWPRSLSPAERRRLHRQRSQEGENRLEEMGLFRWYGEKGRRKKDPRTKQKGEPYAFGVVPLDLSPAELKQLRGKFPGLAWLPPRKPLRVPRSVRVAGTRSTLPAPAEFWHLGVINLLAARQNHQVGNGGAVNVMLMDTGVDAGHPEFGGRAIPSRQLDADSGADLGPSTGDTHGHGTHLAGLIAGRNAGVAPEVRLFALRLMPNGKCTPRALVAALRFAATTETQILNLSLVADPDVWTEAELSSLRGLMAELMAHNILPVCATGNQAGICHAPGDVDAVMTVGASNRFFGLWPNSGSSVVASNPFKTRQPDLVAPGEEVLSSVPGAKYAAFSGTSQATAIVSGIAALRLESRGGQASAGDLIADLNGRTLELNLAAADRLRQGRGLVRV
jgi:hypothetical protein